MSDVPPPAQRTCEWCGSPMTHDGRAVCPSCGRLASRLAAMDPEPPDEVEPPAPPAPPPPKPAAPKPAPAPPSPKPAPPKPASPQAAPPTPKPAAPAAARAAQPRADAPAAPGDRWPTPAPLPPEDEGRAWWKLAVPAAVVVLLVIVGLVFMLGGSDDGPSSASGPDGKGPVDISGLDDPTTTGRPEATTTTEEEATTTTVVTADGRVLVESDRGVSWSMGAPPDITASDAGQTWTAGDGGDVETVFISRGETPDLDTLLTERAAEYDGKLSKILGSHIAEADGRTASFTGTTKDGEAIVGYVVGAVVGDQVVIAETTRIDGVLKDLYIDFLDLPASFDLGR